ncbi:hypothetical protein GCM10011402_33930 [Paracoccus acridae]|uniref:Cupin n=1 Tax=Paracoccus acridae TaxID=1795310 RepID=A0ABQ1VN65_9RHOB|nr:cupin domain-containing protein [Paracoccus acridae]GGF78540.1 hypothetical protein GCM10011402_33930 [Paracoccus acridae]
MRTQAEPVVHIDDDRFRVTEWRFAPGAETGWHRHGHDYVVVPLTDGTLRLDNAGGTHAEARLTCGVPYSRSMGVEHNVINAEDAPLSFLEIEVVDPPTRARLATLARLAECFNHRDLDGVIGCMAEDCSYEPPQANYTKGPLRCALPALRYSPPGPRPLGSDCNTRWQGEPA